MAQRVRDRVGPTGDSSPLGDYTRVVRRERTDRAMLHFLASYFSRANPLLFSVTPVQEIGKNLRAS